MPGRPCARRRRRPRSVVRSALSNCATAASASTAGCKTANSTNHPVLSVVQRDIIAEAGLADRRRQGPVPTPRPRGADAGHDHRQASGSSTEKSDVAPSCRRLAASSSAGSTPSARDGVAQHGSIDRAPAPRRPAGAKRKPTPNQDSVNDASARARDRTAPAAPAPAGLHDAGEPSRMPATRMVRAAIAKGKLIATPAAPAR